MDGITGDLIIYKTHNIMNTYDRQIAEIDKQIADLETKKRILFQEKNRLHVNDKIDNFLHTWCGQALMQKFDINHVAKWEIIGYVFNPDLLRGDQSHLAYVEGSLEKAIGFAVEMESFYGCGYAGTINEIKERNIIKL
jgi:hypothetical protein